MKTKKITYHFVFGILLMNMPLLSNAQVFGPTDDLFVENISNICDYYVTPVAALCCGCTEVPVTALRTLVPDQDTYEFTREQLSEELGCAYKYIGGRVEGYSSVVLYVHNCGTILDWYEEEDNASCTGMSGLSIEYANYSTNMGGLTVSDGGF